MREGEDWPGLKPDAYIEGKTRLGDGEDYFAELLALFQVGVGGGAFLEREDFVDDGFEATLRDEL